ncbi:cytochrome c oxidase accessory protein CcoG [Cellvibrio fibrivorans]|uniref:Cytochrome c oxidase accessory protein FixG n=1 Tax=Cellvibrio fibrivorans TaxID=126350 RepID=A0ABU1V1X9_9GAMM|nr:cytochrome c oxidase accessory protein CcoG [Cellvibrio fibrivorans]MDR7091415.1 cytochrome c oxidase accessory protein FixG [Cellvibrio fibrivorans]
MSNTNNPLLIPLKNLPTPKATAIDGQIVTRSFSGRFRNLRILGAGVLAVLFFGTSWINWNGHQAILWDLDTRQFHVFGPTFWPQDFMLLSLVMIIGAFLLFAVTMIAGRVWCGYTCPQSVWTWAFMWVENITEGDRNQRIKLNSAPASFSKIAKRGAKHSVWLAMSIATGIAFVGYFIPVRELTVNLLQFEWFSTSAIWVFIVAALTYLNAGWVREKVCLHMCPYARFQSVMFDRDTLVISYDAARGDTRGSRKKDEDPAELGLGDCIDCYMCVQVCPTGIDIRDGLQMDCIGCAACIDACDEVMDKMGYARGLVSYTSAAALADEPTRILRPRLVAYATAIIIMLGALWFALDARELVDMSVVKDRTVLYRKNSDGDIVNVYRLKITNKTQMPAHYELHIANDARLSLTRTFTLDLKPGEIVDMPMSVVMKGASAESGMTHFDFVLVDSNRITTREAANFIYPAF